MYGLEVAVVGVTSTAILHAVRYEGKPCEERIKSLECKLFSEITGTRASCSVERRGQSHSTRSATSQPSRGAPHQSGGPTCQRKSFKCSSQVSSRETWHSNPNSRWGEETLGSGNQPEGGCGGD